MKGWTNTVVIGHTVGHAIEIKIFGEIFHDKSAYHRCMCENLGKIGLLVASGYIKSPLTVSAICSMVLGACYLFVYAFIMLSPGY